ncbi:MAG TPA: hypothetical protein VFR81_00560 [Longimicrobium sp.]|nr:hypothetical protein [Longimicrobium sp.]
MVLVFASLARDERLAGAVPGQVVRNESSGPPWIVVDHSVESVVAAGWPGKLWEVELLEAAPEQPREGAGYTRAVAVRVRRELPVSVLFGAHGEDVVRVIAKAASIEDEEVRELASRSGQAARDAYSRAWNAWLAKVEPASFHRGADHLDTLAISAGGTRSPIGAGFLVLSGVFTTRARAVAGESAFETDEEGESCLAGPWGSAMDGLLGAAMALGAPELVAGPDRRILLDAWEHSFGRE